ncbi:MAG: hypothetical protein DBX61_05125 [Clostridiales bacterium]|nr:MAG: hypothetical protein DBX61_05125 [Clostridiales bacterium]
MVNKLAQNWHSRADDKQLKLWYTGIVPKWDRTIGMPFLKQLDALKRYFLLPKLQKEVFGHGQTIG